jgi:glycosyltransferase involved in cell wall biosynthesis
MVRVVYDYQTFALQKYGGISRYFYELATRISANREFEVKVLAFAYLNQYLKQCPPGLVTGFPVPRIPKVQKPLSIVSRELSRLLLHRHPPELLHETFYTSHRLVPKQTRIVTTIHDMMPEKFPEIFGQIFSTEIRQQSVQRADHIICVSEHTKRDLLEIFDVDPSKVSVAYHGSSFEAEDLASLPASPIADPYILYVGTRSAYKNFDRLLKTYAMSDRLKADFKLVCFGGDPLHKQELNLAQELGVAETSIICFAGDDRLLASLYKGASAFIYPSLYEGFGLPLLEAMSLRCPIVCSNTSSLPEVAGDAAEYFNPYELESIMDAIEKVVYSPERVDKLVELGGERVKQFSWQICAEKTCEVYRSLL